MLDNDDSFINDYLAESRENLADIETDLLTLEGRIENMDERLVNKVFRAAHSIKGGAGFFSLSKIQELAHRTENVLDLVRSKEMEPSPDVINILLLAFDRLRELINNHKTSQKSDNSELLVALSGLVSAHLPASQKGSLTKMVKVAAPGAKVVMSIPEFDFNRAKEGNHYIFLVEYDLIDDVQRRGKQPREVFFILESCGRIIETIFELESAGTLDDEPSTRLPLYILFSTELDPDMSDIIFDVPADQIHLIHAPASVPMKPVMAASAPQEPAEPQWLDDSPAQLAQWEPELQVLTEPAPAQAEAQPAPTPVVTAQAAPPHAVTPHAVTPHAVTAQAAPSHPAPAQPAAQAAERQETTLRVDVTLLETLMNLAGELVLSRNQLLEAITSRDQHNIQASSQRINLVTSEIQETIMQTRMQPIGNVFNKYPRVVRDLSRDLGKEINLEIIGRDVEMDKTIIEGLSEPLTHMVRNAVDHGIEPADVRARGGKPITGTVRLKAYHEAGQVVVEVGDDGRGINAEKIAASALAKGLISAEQHKGMSEKEKTALIFMPGLSTAEKISDVSGRGVGMDVVKTNLDKLGGKIEIETHIGKGTNFIIKLPLTLAIIPSLLISVNGERFAIPQVHINELIHIAADQVKKRIEVVGSAEVLILRGSLIPLVRLSDVLAIDRVFQDPVLEAPVPDRRERLADRRSLRIGLDDEQEEKRLEAELQAIKNRRKQPDRRFNAASDLDIVIITSGPLQYGLVVEDLHDTVEIVVKPLGRHLKGLREYAGATILGDGQVALILDAAGIAAKEKLVSLAGTRRARELEQENNRDAAQDRHAFFVFRNTPTEYCAVPMDLVARVSQIRNEQIEWLGGKRTMQYNGGSLPLITLQDVAAVQELLPEQDKAVVVFHVFGRTVGLVVGMPVDVVETNAAVDQETLRQPGVMGSSIIDRHTTLIVDIFELVERTHPDWVVGQEKQAEVKGSADACILLAEDSDFFRGQVRRFLESSGYTVIAGQDGQDAWELLQKNVEKVKLVLSDIEMPRMDGLTLARTIRNDGRFDAVPIIGLSSLAGDEDTARALAAGMNDYHIKLDKDKLLESVRRYFMPSGAGEPAG